MADLTPPAAARMALAAFDAGLPVEPAGLVVASDRTVHRRAGCPGSAPAGPCPQCFTGPPGPDRAEHLLNLSAASYLFDKAEVASADLVSTGPIARWHAVVELVEVADRLEAETADAADVLAAVVHTRAGAVRALADAQLAGLRESSKLVLARSVRAASLVGVSRAGSGARVGSAMVADWAVGRVCASVSAWVAAVSAGAGIEHADRAAEELICPPDADPHDWVDAWQHYGPRVRAELAAMVDVGSLEEDTVMFCPLPALPGRTQLRTLAAAVLCWSVAARGSNRLVVCPARVADALRSGLMVPAAEVIPAAAGDSLEVYETAAGLWGRRCPFPDAVALARALACRD